MARHIVENAWILSRKLQIYRNAPRLSPEVITGGECKGSVQTGSDTIIIYRKEWVGRKDTNNGV